MGGAVTVPAELWQRHVDLVRQVRELGLEGNNTLELVERCNTLGARADVLALEVELFLAGRRGPG